MEWVRKWDGVDGGRQRVKVRETQGMRGRESVV